MGKKDYIKGFRRYTYGAIIGAIIGILLLRILTKSFIVAMIITLIAYIITIHIETEKMIKETME